MKKVEVELRNKRVVSVPERQAAVLVKIGRASYLTRDMVAVQEVEVVDLPEEEEKPKRKYTRRKKEEE